MLNSSEPLGKIAVLRETRPGERRVAITPSIAGTLSGWDYEVCVESGAGDQAGFSDQHYRDNGAAVVRSKDELLAHASIVAWVKPPARPEETLSLISTNSWIVGFAEPYSEHSVLSLCETLGLSVWVHECHDDVPSEMNAMAAMSRFAGRLALEDAIALRSRLEMPAPPKTLIVGAGRAGMAAAQAASRRGHPLWIASTKKRGPAEARAKGLQHRWVELPNEREGDDPAAVLRAQRDRIRWILRRFQPDIIVTTARRSGQPAPLLFPRDTLDMLESGAVVADLTASMGGNTEFTEVDQSVCTSTGAWVCSRSNYPSAAAREASIAYARCMAELLEVPGRLAGHSIA